MRRACAQHRIERHMNSYFPSPGGRSNIRVGATRYSPVKLGVRFSNIAEMPSLRSRDGRKAEFHAAT